MKAVKKIEISVLHKRITPIVYAVQGDTGREIECTVVDWDIPAGVTARVWVVKPSKKVVYNDCRIVDKAVFVPMTNQTLAEPGGAICMIEFVSGEDVVSSFSFNLYVYESASGDGIPSENESTVLEGMFEELAQDAIKTLNEAKAQAAAAKKSAQDTEKIKNDFTLTAQQATADVNNAGQAQAQRVNTAGDTQVSRIQAEGTTQVQNVQATAAEIAADREQIHTNRDNTARLQRTTAGAITRSAEGSFITLEDAAEEMGFRRIEILGMTEQRTTTGAQLLNLPDVENAISNGLTYSIKNGVVTASGTPAVEYASIVAKKIKLPPGNYYASGIDTTSGRLFLQMAITSASGNKTFYSNKGFTIDGTEQSIDFVIQIGSNITALSKCTLYPMLNAGDTPLPWEPYTGSKPSPSPEYPQELENVGNKGSIEITAHSGNLLPYPYDTENSTFNGLTAKSTNSHVKIVGTTTTGTNFFFFQNKTLHPGKYAMKLRGKIAGMDMLIRDMTAETNIAKISSHESGIVTEDSVEFTIVEGHRLMIYFNTGKANTSVDIDVDVVMVVAEKTKDAPYVPYAKHTATITSDHPLTKWDKLTCRDGVWGWAYGGKIKVFTGSEPWSAYENVGYAIYIGEMKPGNYQNDGYSNYFRSVKGTYSKNNQGIWFGADNTSALYVLQVKEIAGTVAEWKTWLSTHPLTLQYQLAAEEWAPLTAQEQAAMNALCTYAGTTHIWTDDPLQPVISLDYTVDTEGYIRETAPAYRDVEKFALTGEASGAVATCTDSAEWPLLGVGMLGKCEQVTTTGAQLLDWNNLTKESCVPIEEGVVRSNITGGYYCALTTTQFNDYILTHKGEQITLSCKGNPAGARVSVVIYGTYSDGKKTKEVDVAGNNVTCIIPEDVLTVNKCEFRFSRRGAAFTDTTTVISDIMLNSGDTALPWEPYTGAAPSPSPAYKQEIQETGTYNPETGMYEADMVMTGAQLLDENDLLDNMTIVLATGAISQYNGRCVTRFTPIHQGRYCAKKYADDARYWKVAFYDSEKKYIKMVYENNVDTANFAIENDGYIVIGFDAPASTVKANNIILNVGSTPLPWEPYQSDTLRLTADQPWRGIGDVHDEVCERDGVLGTWRRYTEDILDGSEDEAWRTTGCSEASHKRFYSNLVKTKAKPAGSNAKVEPILCTAYKAMTANDTYLQKQGISVEIDGTIAVYDDGFSPDADVNGFKARLAEYPITVVYQLKEPYFEPFPDEIQRAYRKLKSYAGTTHAWADDPLQPEVSFRYIKDSKLVLGKLEDRLAALEAGQAQTVAAFSYLPPEIQAEMIETETRELMNSI